MQVAFHLGAHCTDENLLPRSLLKNKTVMRQRRVFVPTNNGFRAVIRDVITRLRGLEANAETQDFLLHEIMGDADADRLILSFDHFLCGRHKVISEGRLYPMAGERARWHVNLFPESPCDLYLGIRNPATFVPALYMTVADKMSFQAFMNGTNPLALRWTDVIRDIRTAAPDCPLTVWCNEDTPLIWPEVLREAADYDQFVELAGGFDVIQSIMTEDGFARMQNYLKTRPPQNEIQRRRVMAAFLDKFAVEEAIDEEVDIPGWTPALIEALTQAYEEDVYEIQRMPGVHLITT
jgi:hypothetical protein